MRLIIAIAALGFSVVATAASTLKPGLWEMTMKSDSTRQMPTLTPEQIKKMREMGVNMPETRDGGVVHRMCMTKEMVEHDRPPMGREGSECKLKNYNRSGGSYRAELECDGPNMKGTGIIKGRLASSESFSSTYDFQGTARGQEVKQHHESNGRWLSGDCGNVKPIGEMTGTPQK